MQHLVHYIGRAAVEWAACIQVWANVCQPKGDYSNECSLGVFRNAAISQWSQESLAKANATREVRSCLQQPHKSPSVPNECTSVEILDRHNIQR